MSEAEKLVKLINSVIKFGEVKEIDVDDVIEHPDNPQVMDDERYNLLVDNIRKIGLVEFPQVYPKNGKYIIVGGHKRYNSLKYLGIKKFPAVVYDPKKFTEKDVLGQLVRMNVIRGRIDPVKFTKLYEKATELGIDDEAKRIMWGFVSREEMERYIEGVIRELPEEISKEVKKAKDEIKTIDDLALILNRLFSEYGDTLDYNFMVFDWGGKEHLWVRCNKDLWKKVQELVKISKEKKKDINDLFLEVFKNFNILKNGGGRKN